MTGLSCRGDDPDMSDRSPYFWITRTVTRALSRYSAPGSEWGWHLADDAAERVAAAETCLAVRTSASGYYLGKQRRRPKCIQQYQGAAVELRRRAVSFPDESMILARTAVAVSIDGPESVTPGEVGCRPSRAARRSADGWTTLERGRLEVHPPRTNYRISGDRLDVVRLQPCVTHPGGRD
jgi:hypothetical protein